MKQNKSLYGNGFTVGMALMDFIPTALFFVGGILAFKQIYSPIFFSGIVITTLAGLFKASWKLIFSLSHRDIQILTKLFHILMPCGFILILLSIPFTPNTWNTLLKEIITMPSLIFVILGCIGMAMMILFAVKLDGKKARSNWIEQSTNAIAQSFFVIALMLIK
jgi:hypothetical protein